MIRCTAERGWLARVAVCAGLTAACSVDGESASEGAPTAGPSATLAPSTVTSGTERPSGNDAPHGVNTAAGGTASPSVTIGMNEVSPVAPSETGTGSSSVPRATANPAPEPSATNAPPSVDDAMLGDCADGTVIGCVDGGIANDASGGLIDDEEETVDAVMGVPPEPYGELLSAAQLRWLENEMLMFAHFGIKTYYISDDHLGDGMEDPERFNPTSFDASQWTEACDAAGFGGVVLTTKHHDGFCNWPTATTEHNVAASPWRDGNGDVVGAFKERGLWVGLYLSAYDLHYINSGAPGDAYNEYFLTQLTELCENYGPIDELWFDGFGAENVTVNLEERDQLIRQLQPDSVSFEGTVNPIRWPGNEACVVDEPNWYQGAPYEADCIAQGNWFWNNTPIVSLARLQEIFRTSTARGAVALINVSPNPDGLIDAASIERLQEFGDWVRSFAEDDIALGKDAVADNTRPGFGPELAVDGDPTTYWATDNGVHTATLEVDLGEATSIRAATIQEYLPLGQRVASHRLAVWLEGQWREVASATTIGHKRVLEFEAVTTSRVRLEIAAQAPITIQNFMITAE